MLILGKVQAMHVAKALRQTNEMGSVYFKTVLSRMSNGLYDVIVVEWNGNRETNKMHVIVGTAKGDLGLRGYPTLTQGRNVAVQRVEYYQTQDEFCAAYELDTRPTA
jgi:hypothetical protein